MAICVALLSLDIHGLGGAGDPKTSGLTVVPSSRAAWQALDKGAHDFLDKEYETVVAEIGRRIEQEHLLFALKFGIVGAILYTFLQEAFRRGNMQYQRSAFGALVAWAAVLVASLVDLRIAANQSFLITLGGWTRQYEELKLGANAVHLGWEAFLADQLLSQSYYPALRVSGQVLTVFLFAFTSALFFLPKDNDNDSRTSLVSASCAVLGIFLMTGAAVSRGTGPSAMWLYIAFGGLAMVLAVFLALMSMTNPQSPEAALSAMRPEAMEP
jgi:predicted neutral ceramidase superfamily lipid hydrolase